MRDNGGNIARGQPWVIRLRANDACRGAERRIGGSAGAGKADVGDGQHLEPLIAIAAHIGAAQGHAIAQITHRVGCWGRNSGIGRKRLNGSRCWDGNRRCHRGRVRHRRRRKIDRSYEFLAGEMAKRSGRTADPERTAQQVGIVRARAIALSQNGRSPGQHTAGQDHNADGVPARAQFPNPGTLGSSFQLMVNKGLSLRASPTIPAARWIRSSPCRRACR